MNICSLNYEKVYPDITPDFENGLGKWSKEAFVNLLLSPNKHVWNEYSFVAESREFH